MYKSTRLLAICRWMRSIVDVVEVDVEDVDVIKATFSVLNDG